MKPSYYLETEEEKIRSFFRSFSLHKDLTVDLERININKIWIDEAENCWEMEYSYPAQPNPGLLNILSEHIKNSFSLKELTWKQLAYDAVSISGVASEVSRHDSEMPETNPVFDQYVPPEEIPPDADCEPGSDIEEDETYMQAYNALYGNKYADG